MNVRSFDQDIDYKHLSEWWTKWEWPVIPMDHLPPIGIVISSDGEDLAMGFLYRTDSRFAWLEWATGNPDSNKFLRREALDILFKELIAKAKREDFSTIFTTMRHPGLITRAQDHGFQVTDVGMTNLVMRI